jgi:hypothetical protein
LTQEAEASAPNTNPNPEIEIHEYEHGADSENPISEFGGTSKNTFHSMRQVSTQPEKQALAFANAGVSSEKVRFLEVPLG